MTEPRFLDRSSPVRTGEELDLSRLETYLLTNLPTASAPLTIEQFPRGYSNLTYLLRLGDRELVLRRPPFGVNIKSAHDMGREYRILSALHPVYRKAPKPLLYCSDLEILGAPFYVMERVPGIILRTRIPDGLTIKPEQMRQLSEALVDTLVELHAVDYNTAGLHTLGKPEGYVGRQVTGWIQRYANARTDDLPEMEAATRWLSEQLPTIPDDGQSAALIHNDFKYDNVIINPAALSNNPQSAINNLQSISAVLDWEMATIGHPLMDLGTTLGYWAEADDEPALRNFGITALPGNLTRRQFVDRYARLSGRNIDAIGFYHVFGLFKIGVIIQQIYARYKQGATQDPRFATLDQLVVACGKTAVRAMSGEMW
ncbi:MAG: phosphotransferase family protein [Caldilineaceae bacterium]